MNLRLDNGSQVSFVKIRNYYSDSGTCISVLAGLLAWTRTRLDLRRSDGSAEGRGLSIGSRQGEMQVNVQKRMARLEQQRVRESCLGIGASVCSCVEGECITLPAMIVDPYRGERGVLFTDECRWAVAARSCYFLHNAPNVNVYYECDDFVCASRYLDVEK
jgi:hypothetical protein